SSNAAVTLLGLARLWKTDAGPDLLLELASGLGADVPFFLRGGCARATGTGTVLFPLASNDEEVHHLIIITPRAAVATPDAYAALRSPALTMTSAEPMLSSSHRADNFRHSPPWTGRSCLP